MKKVLLVSLLAVLLSYSGFGQMLGAAIGGTVTGVTSGQPIANHQVYVIDSISGINYTAITDMYGFYLINVPVAGGTVGFAVVYTYGLCGPNDVYYATTMLQINTMVTLNFAVCDSATNPSSCQAAFGFQTTSNPSCANLVDFTDNSTSTGSITAYMWSFGDSSVSYDANPQHCYAYPGTYYACLTITTSDGCTSSSCQAVTVGNTITGYTMSGYVATGAMPLQNGLVLVMGTSGFSATSTLDNMGYYSVTNLLPDDYIVLAIPMDSSLVGYVPTYHESSLFWNTADVIVLNSDTLANVFLQSVSTTTGPGTVGGTILWNSGQKTAGFTAPNYKNTSQVNVILTDEYNDLQRFTASAPDGSFQIENLPVGNYILHVDIPGIAVEPYSFELTESSTSLNGFVVDVNNGSIAYLGMNDLTAQAQLIAFPNPFTETLNLQIPEAAGTPELIRVFDAMGKLVYSLNTSDSSLEFNTSSWKQGIYFIEIQNTNAELLHMKLIK